MLASVMKAFVQRHIAPFFDPAALVLWLISVGVLLTIDPVMVKTLVQWSLFFFALAGVVVVISRVVFPYINLPEMVVDAYRGNTAAGLVVLAVGLFMSFGLLALALWAKA